MLRQLISKWGVMSIDIVQAVDADMAVIREDGTKEYVENEESFVDTKAADVETEELVGGEHQEQETASENDVTASFFS